MYNVTVKVFREYPSCLKQIVHFDDSRDAKNYMVDASNNLFKQLREGKIQSYDISIDFSWD